MPKAQTFKSGMSRACSLCPPSRASLSSHSVLASRFQNSQTVSPLLLPRFDELGAANALQPRQAVTNPCRSNNTRSLSHCWRNESNQCRFPNEQKARGHVWPSPANAPFPPDGHGPVRTLHVGGLVSDIPLWGGWGPGSVSLACKAKSI